MDTGRRSRAHEPSTPPRRAVPLWARALALGVAYMAAVQLGHVLSPAAGRPVMLPQAGLLVAALLLSEPAEWPLLLAAGVAGSLGCDAIHGRSLSSSTVLSVGAALTALAGAAMVRRTVGARPGLGSVKEIVSIAAFAALLAPFAGAALSTAALMPLTGAGSWWPSTSVLWLADVVGVAVFAPLVLAAAGGVADLRAVAEARGHSLRRAVVEVCLSAAGMFTASWLVFSPALGDGRWKFLLILGSLVAASRLGPLGGSITLASVAVAGAGGLALYAGRVAPAVLPGRIVEMQAFFTVTGISLLALAAVGARSRRAAAEANATAQKYRILLEAFPVGVVITDDHGHVTESSTAASDILRVDRDLLSSRGIGGRGWRALRPDGTRMPPEEFPAVSALVDTRAIAGREMGVVTGDGATVWLDVTAAPIPAEGYGVVAAFTDITEKVTARAALERAKNELEASEDRLEAEVAARTAELERTNVELSEASAAKSRFLANMSHELRTPLNSVIGFAGVLLQGLAGRLNEEQARQIGMIKRAGDHLLSLVNDILDLNRIEEEGQSLRVSEFVLKGLVDEVMATIRPLAEAKALDLRIECGCKGEVRMRSDRGRIKQVLLNLLGNAVKFTDEGSVTLSCASAEGRIRFAVTDTGIGIPAEEVPLVMDEFHQVDRSDGMKPMGTGLGLAISRRLVGLLGGSITLVSVEGEGTTFTVDLPVEIV